MTRPKDPQTRAGHTLEDIEVSLAEAWRHVEAWDYDRFMVALRDIAAHVEGWTS